MDNAPSDVADQINAALRSYCRGIDRLDQAAILAAFHPGAELVDYRPEPTTIEAFAPAVVETLSARYTATQHRLSNTTIEVGDDGRSALVETYVLAYHVEPTDEGDKLLTFDGRYIDRFEERAGVWRIARRTLRSDWTKVEAIEETMRAGFVPSGRGGSPDPLYDPAPSM